jgi:flagellar biosynthetic protein FlhB
MADSPSSGDCHLPASPRKLEKAREQGQVARSRDLSHFAAVVGVGALLFALAPGLGAELADAMRDALRFDGRALAHPDAMGEQLFAFVLRMGALVLPIAGAAILAAVAAALAAGGWNWTWKPLAPNFGKLDPIGGLGRIVSKQQLVDALKASVLALVLGTIGTLYLHAHSQDFGAIFGMDLGAATASAAGVVRGGLVLIAAALAVFALIDLPLQRRLHADRLKMSHQELKQEHKELEGNVEMKGRVRARMREMTRKRMMAAVPKADLVVMNPTHYAVALKYDDTKMAAPRVVAKGADVLALKIRDLAAESKVPVLQAPVLARALYAHTKLDHEVPAALFAAVAQVLAYVYQLRAALAGAAPMPGELPDLNVPAELDPHVKPVAADEDEE